MGYAAGKYAYGLCDICGQRYKHSDLRKNWKGLMVCGADYEPKEPQLYAVRHTADAISLRDPRPDRIEPTVVNVGEGKDSRFLSAGMQPAEVSKSVKGTAIAGSVTVSIS